jgi:hypothetical protein
MDNTNSKAHAYSGEPIKIATVGTATNAAMPMPWAFLSQLARQVHSAKTQLLALRELLRAARFSSLEEFTDFLKHTRRVWLTAAAALILLFAALDLVQQLIDWARNARLRRQELAVASVNPDRLIARCGPATDDVSKEIYPIVMRTMTYQPKGRESVVLVFSRTDEDNSPWVFLSMHDERRANSYETPQAKIAALPCLDSTR